ncbi:unnamed protein product [Gemmataceae bacterium]|nr:unnamed protein product [Gemmataceae bacterium]VTT96853.1 unnamed protein product [Gemmataceae bacterium]
MAGATTHALRVESLEDRAVPAYFGLFGGDIFAPALSLMTDPGMMTGPVRVRAPAATFLAPDAPGIVFHPTPDATAEAVAPPVPEFDPTQFAPARPKVAEEPLDEVSLKFPPPPPVVEYELPECGEPAEGDAAAPASPAFHTFAPEVAADDPGPPESVPGFVGDLIATPEVADLAGAAEQFLDTLGAALADPADPGAVWDRIGYWAVAVGGAGVALEVARQRLRARSPHTGAPTLVVRQ